MADLEHLKIARAGKSAWNAWRRTHPSERADFSGADFGVAENRDIVFSEFEFGDSANFSDTIFGATPIGYQKHGVDPHRGSAEGAALFVGAVFGKGTSFRGARFGYGARFDGAEFGQQTTFLDADFADAVDFSAAVFGEEATFEGACFGNDAKFCGALFLGQPRFKRALFGKKATFEGASFDRAYFGYSVFGHEATFDDAVFAELVAAVQFDYAVFGNDAHFRGTAFEGPAFFYVAEFGDRASFEANDQGVFNDAATKKAELLPESYRQIYQSRARAADPMVFKEISFCRARFTSGDVSPCAGESVIRRILRWPKRLLKMDTFPPYLGSPSTGASFRGRTIRRVGDFSRAQFDQPPDFRDVQQADNLDLTGAVFSFRASAWPWWRYWTTQTETATRVRRLRGLASDIHADDAERDLFILERMAERGIAWRAWWDRVLRPWDSHQSMRPTADDCARRWNQPHGLPRNRPRGLARWRGAATSAWFALCGVGRPVVLTALIFCYRFLSDFGRSVVLPTVWLVVSQFAFGVWYGTYQVGGMRWETVGLLANFTLANAIPFVGASRQALGDSAATLFPRIVPVAVPAIALVHGLVTAVLLFLIILALRNHFRVR